MALWLVGKSEFLTYIYPPRLNLSDSLHYTQVHEKKVSMLLILPLLCSSSLTFPLFSLLFFFVMNTFVGWDVTLLYACHSYSQQVVLVL